MDGASLIRFWLTVPVKVSSHAHRRKARIFVPKASMRWWRIFLQTHYPKRKPGRPARDWLVYGEDRFANHYCGKKLRRVSGDRYDRATGITGIDRAVLKIYAHVSRRVSRAARCAMLSWEHHKAVARLAPPQQQRWLAIAASQPPQERISSRRLRASIIKGRVVAVEEMAVPPSEQGISNHIPPINRLSVWWKTVGGTDFLKGRSREQLAALRRDFNPVSAILKQIDDAIVRKLQDTLL